MLSYSWIISVIYFNRRLFVLLSNFWTIFTTTILVQKSCTNWAINCSRFDRLWYILVLEMYLCWSIISMNAGLNNERSWRKHWSIMIPLLIIKYMKWLQLSYKYLYWNAMWVADSLSGLFVAYCLISCANVYLWFITTCGFDTA